MVKTNVPGQIVVGGHRFVTNVLPDTYDPLDLPFYPGLGLLRARLDQRAGKPIVDQRRDSATGHAVAALVATVLAVPPPRKRLTGPTRDVTTRVSPYMLEALAQRYGGYPGAAGSSLRGALKGWFRHGVSSEATWPAQIRDRDLYDPAFMAECAKTPLGAYYRVNVQRIDDMQSALNDLNAVAVSAAIHGGWRAPRRRLDADGTPTWVIEASDTPLGGHAFLIAGYNDVGFLVQNSWGPTWGRSGYATLPYEDWLANAYDAWVARPGVPRTKALRSSQSMVQSAVGLVATAGPNLGRLPDYVVDVTAGGLPSGTGKVSSSPAQIDGLVRAMAAQHRTWVKETGTSTRQVVIYAHGGLVGESGGISIADRMIDWWKANRIYPVHVVWESDAVNTIIAYLEQKLREIFPFALFKGIEERIDRTLEGFGRGVRPLWEEMKTNARLASAPLSSAPIDWTSHAPGHQPGASLFVDRLAAYKAGEGSDLKVHLVGHSAGAVVLAALLERLVAAGIQVESMQVMAGAIRSDEFVRLVIPHLRTAPGGSGKVRRFVAYDLTEKSEQDDACPGGPVAVYHKSLLYFVARSLEASTGAYEVPMLGLSKELAVPWKMPDGTTRPLIDAIGGVANAVICPNTAVQADQRSRASGHGQFDEDTDTMTSVLLRIMDRHTLGSLTPYPPGGMPSHGIN